MTREQLGLVLSNLGKLAFEYVSDASVTPVAARAAAAIGSVLNQEAEPN
jgi:hypothetical protein